MSDYKIQNISYSIASSNYDKYSKAVAKTSSLDEVKVSDYVIINQKDSKDTGGVETSIGNTNNVLHNGDKIVVKQQEKSNGFFNLIQAQLNKIAATEKVSTESIDQESSLLQVSESIAEAEIALQQVVQIRDKIVSGFNEITKMAF
jgi:flagellar hook-basal body complex protein FliE